jgi:hypothetical protein
MIHAGYDVSGADDAGDAGCGQKRAQAQGYGAGQAIAPVGAAGDGGRMEDRLPDGWGEAVGRRRPAPPLEFPENRENNREFRKFPAILALPRVNLCNVSSALL